VGFRWITLIFITRKLPTMPKPKKRLTAQSVARVRAPKQGRLEIADKVVPGLTLRVTEKGSKSWSLLFRVAGAGGYGPTGRLRRGNLKRLTIGAYPKVDVTQARILARQALELADQGINPAQKKAESVQNEFLRQERTIERVADDFIRLYCRPNLRSWREIQRTLHLHVIPHWGPRPITEITRRDAIALLDELVSAGVPYAAADVLKRTRRLFNWAVDRDELEHSPFDRVRLPIKLASRDRTLSEREIQSVWNSAKNLGWPFGHMYKLLLLSGQRRNEIARMRWDWLRLNQDIPALEIPAEFYKSGRSHVVPIPPIAVQLLESSPGPRSGYVLSTTNGERPISGFSKAKKRIDVSCGFSDWRTHDLRRTVATQLARMGFDQALIDRVLGHATPGVRGIYNQYAYVRERYDALSAWERALMSIMGSSW
jgi:integrase